MKLKQAGAYALISLTVFTILGMLATRGLKDVLHALSWGAYLPLSIATAAAIMDLKGLIVGLVGLTILMTVPTGMQEFAHAILPTGAGIILGSAIRAGIKEGV